MEYKYSFVHNNIDVIISLNFLSKKIEVYENPWGRESTSSPDLILSFGETNHVEILKNRFEKSLSLDILSELEFLTNHYFIYVKIPNGNRLFFVKSSSSYFKSKEKINLNVGISFFIVAIILLIPVFFPNSTDIKQLFSRNSRILLFTSSLCLLYSIILCCIYYKRVITINEFYVLGTEHGIYLYKDNRTEFFAWNAFIDTYEKIEFEKGFRLFLVESENIYNKFGSRKANKPIDFVGLDKYEFYFEIIRSRITKNLK